MSIARTGALMIDAVNPPRKLKTWLLPLPKGLTVQFLLWGSNNVKNMVENIGYVSAQSAQAVRDVSTSGEEMRNVVNNVARSSEALAQMAWELEAMTARFKLQSS